MHGPQDTTPGRKLLGQFPGYRGKGKGPKRDPKLFKPYKKPDKTPVRSDIRPVLLPSPVASEATAPDLNESRSTLYSLVSQIGKVVNRVACSRMPDVNDQPVPVCPSCSLQTNRRGVSVCAPPAPPVTPPPKCQIECYSTCVRRM